MASTETPPSIAPKPSKGTLTSVQCTYLDSFESDFKAYILASSKGDKKAAEAAAKKWKDTHIVEMFTTIRRDFPYPSTWTVEVTDVKLKQYIRRYFGNFLQGTLVRTGVLQPTLTEPAANNAIFTAPPPRTARQLYAEDEKEGILELANNLKQEVGGNAAGLYQTALKTSWSGIEPETKAKYEEAAHSQASNIDVSRNQSEFEANIGGTLQDLCTNGAIGPAEMVLFASFRNHSDGDLTAFVVHAHSDENQRSFIEFVPNFTALEGQWAGFSKEVLPRRSQQEREAWAVIPRNSAGIPIFPPVDFDDTTRIGLAEITNLFLRVAWDHTWPSDDIYKSLPYDELVARPHKFYDTERFNFHPTLATPLQKMSLSQLSSIVEYLIEISDTNCPFAFRQKQDIQAISKTVSPTPSTVVVPSPMVSPVSLPVPPVAPTMPQPLPTVSAGSNDMGHDSPPPDDQSGNNPSPSFPSLPPTLVKHVAPEIVSPPLEDCGGKNPLSSGLASPPILIEPVGQENIVTPPLLVMCLAWL
ncbi:hypothetical protein C8R43DRAFT_1162879 [Mycena crocata]|nr:hypothetical protein C8R43DRAFT_1162879 [Mycena crocata]